MIQEISINNFKQLRELTLKQVAPITIIGGKNNTGKTTLLEALFMFYDRAHPEVILRHRHWRGVNLIDLSPSRLWAPIFHAYDMHNEVVISIKENNKHEKLVIKHNREFNRLIKTTPLDERVLKTKALQSSFPTESLEFNYFLEGEPAGDAHCIIDGEQLGIELNNVKPSKKNLTYISSVTQIDPNEDAIRFGQMDIEDRVQELIEGLQLIEPRLKSLSSISHGNHSLIYGDLGKKMPLSFMGEGTAKLLSIMLAIATSRGGIVLIDELENGVHYSVHSKLWYLLMTLSKRYDCQLFLTTHSYEMIKSLKGAVEDYYGQVELIPGIVCDGYVLDNDTAVMSEWGTADLLSMDHAPLKRMVLNWPPKTLEPFIDKGFSMVPNSVKVVAKNSPYKGRKIIVYTAETVEALISTYALSLAHRALRSNQRHIGERCVILLKSLAALDTAIKQACGLSPNIQQTAQKNYIDAVKLIKDFGFTCSAGDDIAIKKDITQFLNVPESTLNSFLRKHKNDIQPIQLDAATIRSIGGKASRMNGYHIDDVTSL
jgi:AAA15 family ATPase/GTPase